jgi:hypothetical protein
VNTGVVVKPVEKTTVVQETQTETMTAKVPAKTSSTDEIVDYLVDGLSGDSKTTAEANIDSTKASSQADAGSSLNTNF